MNAAEEDAHGLFVFRTARVSRSSGTCLAYLGALCIFLKASSVHDMQCLHEGIRLRHCWGAPRLRVCRLITQALSLLDTSVCLSQDMAVYPEAQSRKVIAKLKVGGEIGSQRVRGLVFTHGRSPSCACYRPVWW